MEGGGVPGAIGRTFLDWKNKKLAFFLLESFQKILKIYEKFINFENYKVNFVIYWKTL